MKATPVLLQFQLNQLLASAKGDPKGYLTEAVANYATRRSYRSCVGSIHNAVYTNVLSKLQNLVEVNQKHRKIYEKANRLKHAHKSYEHGLAEDLFKANLLSDEQREYLIDLRPDRNDVAHPFEGDVSAAKAAYFLADAVRLFLSQDSLSPTMVIDEIVERLGGDNYFPSDIRNSLQASIVSAEISRLIPEAYHLFARRLLESWNGDNPTLRSNTGIFVRQAVFVKDSTLREAILGNFVQPLLNHLNGDDAQLVMSMILSQPAWLRDFDDTLLARLTRAISWSIANAPRSKARVLFEEAINLEITRWHHGGEISLTALTNQGPLMFGRDMSMDPTGTSPDQSRRLFAELFFWGQPSAPNSCQSSRPT